MTHLHISPFFFSFFSKIILKCCSIHMAVCFGFQSNVSVCYVRYRFFVAITIYTMHRHAQPNWFTLSLHSDRFNELIRLKVSPKRKPTVRLLNWQCKAMAMSAAMFWERFEISKNIQSRILFRSYRNQNKQFELILNGFIQTELVCVASLIATAAIRTKWKHTMKLPVWFFFYSIDVQQRAMKEWTKRNSSFYSINRASHPNGNSFHKYQLQKSAVA